MNHYIPCVVKNDDSTEQFFFCKIPPSKYVALSIGAPVVFDESGIMKDVVRKHMHQDVPMPPGAVEMKFGWPNPEVSEKLTRLIESFPESVRRQFVIPLNE